MRMAGNSSDIISATSSAHAKLNGELAEGLPFVSDWDCLNPLAVSYLDAEFSLRGLGSVSLKDYSRLQADAELIGATRIYEFGEDWRRDDIAILAGSGMTSLLSTFLAFLGEQNYNILATSPMHHTVPETMTALRLQPTWVGSTTAGELRLPRGSAAARSCLLIADPIWYAGIRLSPEVCATVLDWQRATGGLVLIDETFANLDWVESAAQLRAMLDPSLTIRGIAPTKAVAIHGVRFAYLVVPRNMFEPLYTIYHALHGANGLTDQVLGRTLMRGLASAGNADFLYYARSEWLKLREDFPELEPRWEPTLGYFAFCKGPFDWGRTASMGSPHFMDIGNDDYRRLNVLAPRLREGLEISHL